MRIGYLLRRVAMLAVTLLVASFLIFGASYVAPGSPLAALSGGKSLSPEAQATLEHRYHLDQSFVAQYGHWLSGAVRGDLGVSIPLHEDVSSLIADRAWITLSLVLYAAILIVVIGIGLGLLAGLRPGWIDSSILVISSMAAAVPAFVAAIVLIAVFAVSLGWFPTIGTGEGFLGNLRHLTLPAFALALSSVAVVARVTRTAIREEVAREHVQTAISRGIPQHLVVTRHVLRNAAIPITTVTGVTVASLIAISSVVETSFGLNGLGQYLVKSAQSKDLAVVQGISLVLVVAFVVVNLVVDTMYAVLDPRVQLGTRAA
ncbi:ABC transporter permease [Nocardioides ginsengisoli]|uniref:ABC transporter permease n=1 Tax=Nocardioides ginsengisoli TaxID=363868 RepID=A0ABW3W0W8_9ACTN